MYGPIVAKFQTISVSDLGAEMNCRFASESVPKSAAKQAQMTWNDWAFLSRLA
jgi:hypothetical protein